MESANHRKLFSQIALLPAPDVRWVDDLVAGLLVETENWRSPSSDVINGDDGLHAFGNSLKVHHHLFSHEPFRREKFEFVLERVLKEMGREVQRATSRTEKWDIAVDGVRWSLKTQADEAIRADVVTVAKWMELGKGVWTDEIGELKKLRGLFFDHIEQYDRIFTLRCLTRLTPKYWHYELVEIPKKLLLGARRGEFEFGPRSETIPRSGHCTVTDRHGVVLFRLYFDGGGERKLWLKQLRMDKCVRHASWRFAR